MIVDLTERQRCLIRDALNIQAEIAMIHDLKELANEYYEICRAIPPGQLMGMPVLSQIDSRMQIAKAEAN